MMVVGIDTDSDFESDSEIKRRNQSFDVGVGVGPTLNRKTTTRAFIDQKIAIHGVTVTTR